MEWYHIDNIAELDTPALVVYPDRVKENIRKAIAMAGDPSRLRPHVKTHKNPEVTKLMLAAGIQQFKCATIAEAEMLAMAEAPDVLLAYQPWGPKAERLARLIKAYPGTRFSCLIDNPESAKALSQIFKAAGQEVAVFLDLDVGMGRTGIVPGPEADQLYKEALQMDGIQPIGLHAYDGHLRDEDIEVRTQKCDEAFARVKAMQQRLNNDLLIVAGGSPTFPIHSQRLGVQCSPGTFIYWDRGYGEGLKEQTFLPAALVITRVLSVLGSSHLCLDLGHKSIAAENPIDRRVYFLNGPDLKPVSQSEEHLVVEVHPAHNYTIGDVFYGIPIHICPTVALYERAMTVENGNWTGEWKNTARDRIINI